MGTKVKTFVGSLAGCVLFVSTAAAQTQPPSLDKALHRSVCERIQAPMVFSTRDTTFALSLPTDEPAMVSLQVTVGKNGKVKEKLTRVNANHIAGYVAPAFLAATKDLRIDRNLLGTLSGKDTSLTLTFPLEYQCVYDTINKEWPDMRLKSIAISDLRYSSSLDGSNSEIERQKEINKVGSSPLGTDSYARWRYKNTLPSRVWYYLAFIKDQSE